MCRRGRCRGWASRADRRRHWTPRTGPRHGASTPACRWPRCSRRRSRRYRAAPGCRGDRRGPRWTTSPVRWACAKAGPAATPTSRSRSARRGRCRRDGVRESRASRHLSRLLLEPPGASPEAPGARLERLGAPLERHLERLGAPEPLARRRSEPGAAARESSTNATRDPNRRH